MHTQTLAPLLCPLSCVKQPLVEDPEEADAVTNHLTVLLTLPAITWQWPHTLRAIKVLVWVGSWCTEINCSSWWSQWVLGVANTDSFHHPQNGVCFPPTMERQATCYSVIDCQSQQQLGHLVFSRVERKQMPQPCGRQTLPSQSKIMCWLTSTHLLPASGASWWTDACWRSVAVGGE